MKFLKIIFIIILVLLLTILTQVGGIILLISLISHRYIKGLKNIWIQFFAKLSIFFVLYFVSVFTLVPYVAQLSGRVPLPVFERSHLKPATILTVLLNRNYVRSELRASAFAVAEEMNKKYPGTTINYLDANFPFINKFPLLPHLSHNDGKKLDLSFLYNANTGEHLNEVPSFIGYGVCEEPKPDEYNMPSICASQGYWQYNALNKIVSQKRKKELLFDAERTKSMVNLFAAQKSIGRMFIEPHLKTRLVLTNAKVVFHGCHAVRHDDHLHVQLH